MIKTIFYFVPTEAEYDAAITKGDITSRTIVFIEETRTIYLNGKAYGKVSLDGLVTADLFNLFKRESSSELNSLRSSVSENIQNINNNISRIDNDILDATTALNNSIEDAVSSISSVSENLNEFKEDVGRQIEDDIEDAITNSDGESIWTALDKVESGVNSVTTKFNNITDEDGNIKYTNALQLVMDHGISENESITNLQNRWALLDDNEDVLKWIASGFVSHAGEEDTFASVFSAMVEDVNGQEGSLYSGLLTRIHNVENAGYVSTATLAAEMASKLGVSSLSQLALKSDIDEASAELGTAILRIADEQGNIEENIANITTTVDRNSAVVRAIATVDDNQSIIWNSATIDGVVAGILASGTTRSGQSVNALITANVKDDQSWITLSADLIHLDGDVIALRLTAAGAKIGGFSIGENSLSTDTTALRGFVEINSGAEETEFAEAIPPQLICGYNMNQAYSRAILDCNGFRTLVGDRRMQTKSISNQINSDGSGSIGNNGISWDAQGNFLANSTFANAVVNVAKQEIINWVCQGLTALHHEIDPTSTEKYWDYDSSTGFFVRTYRPDPEFEE